MCTIYDVPKASADDNLRTDSFLDLFRRGLSAADAQQQLDTATGWGRYAELLEAKADQITLAAAAYRPSWGEELDHLDAEAGDRGERSSSRDKGGQR